MLLKNKFFRGKDKVTQVTPKTGWKQWSLPIRIGVAGGACLLIGKDLSWTELKGAFAELQLWTIFVGIIVFSVGQCLVGFRWWLLLRAQQISVSLGMAEKLTFLGLFFSNFLPSSVGGDLVRAWYVSRYSSRKLQAALGVLVDRIMGLLSTLILAFVSIYIFMRDVHLFALQQTKGLITHLKILSGPHLMLLCILLIGAVLVLRKPFGSIGKRILRHIAHILHQLHQVICVYCRHPLVLLWGLLLTLFLQSIVIIAYWLIGQDLNIEASLYHYFVFFPLVWVVGSIPVSIAGIGILEGGLVFLFVHYCGASNEAAAALALCQRLTWLGASLPGMYFHLTGSHRKVRYELTNS
jgi:uncharacterized protein (TIRG00374 family)